MLGELATQSYWSLKEGTSAFYYRSNEPPPYILGPLVRNDHSWEKTTTNKRASVIFLLTKNKNSTFQQIKS